MYFTYLAFKIGDAYILMEEAPTASRIHETNLPLFIASKMLTSPMKALEIDCAPRKISSYITKS